MAQTKEQRAAWMACTRAKRAAFVNNYKASRGCCVCGECDPIVLDFHHRDGKEK